MMPRVSRVKSVGVVVAVAIGLVSLAGCGGSSPTTPSPSLTAAGTWRGPITDNVLGTAQNTVVLTQSGNTVTGTATGGTPTDLYYGTSSWNGTISGTTLTATFRTTYPALPLCVGTGTITAQLSATALQGSYTGSNTCGSVNAGQIALTR